MATELTEAQLIDKVDSYNTALDALLTDSSGAFSYSLGDITVSRAEYYRHLLEMRDYYLRELRLQQASGGDAMRVPDYEISPFGEALGEEVDED